MAPITTTVTLSTEPGRATVACGFKLTPKYLAPTEFFKKSQEHFTMQLTLESCPTFPCRLCFILLLGVCISVSLCECACESV